MTGKDYCQVNRSTFQNCVYTMVGYGNENIHATKSTHAFFKRKISIIISSLQRNFGREIKSLETVSARIWTLNQFALPFSPPYCIYAVQGREQKHPNIHAGMAPLQTGTGTNNHRWYNDFPHPNLHSRKISALGVSKVLVALMFVSKADFPWDHKTQKKK